MLQLPADLSIARMLRRRLAGLPVHSARPSLRLQRRSWRMNRPPHSPSCTRRAPGRGARGWQCPTRTWPRRWPCPGAYNEQYSPAARVEATGFQALPAVCRQVPARRDGLLRLVCSHCDASALYHLPVGSRCRFRLSQCPPMTFLAPPRSRPGSLSSAGGAAWTPSRHSRR